ncbi:MAG: sigma-70 family RNA polymerase sigma factor [Muribaculaceae bacterium]|nr:sigma-70 family RNA polymerase sigma factor [Muribaculaceae bacterium]
MKTSASTRENIIAQSYVDHHARVLNYVSARVNDRFDAENIAQDVWVRLIECGKELAAESLTSLIFTIAHNLVNDYLRRFYLVQSVREELTAGATEPLYDAEAEINSRDLASHEHRFVECMPTQRRTIYIMSRYDDMSVGDIADSLDLSFRTVENHLRLGRRDVRAFMSAIA